MRVTSIESNWPQSARWVSAMTRSADVEDGSDFDVIGGEDAAKVNGRIEVRCLDQVETPDLFGRFSARPVSDGHSPPRVRRVVAIEPSPSASPPSISTPGCSLQASPNAP